MEGNAFSYSAVCKKKWRMDCSGYACSEWQPLREVTEPKCKGRMSKQKKSKQKESEQLPADSLMKRINGDVDAMLDCAEENF